MYKKVNANQNYVEREKQVEEFWKDNEIFEKSLVLHDDKKNFVFYDGPPTANGKPHIGHVLTRAIKDLFPRFQTMKGFNVSRKAGWDTHGLPVELEVEKEIGINGKDEIENYGIAPFIEHCKESVWKYRSMWEEFSEDVGFWADMEHPYVTYHNDYIESEWWALKQIWDKGLLYRGFKIVPYCPRCGTPLSSHEVAQGYKDVKERSAIVRFKLKDSDVSILVWTTTPWTLPSNVAVCVNPNEEYITAKMLETGEELILAKALADTVLGEGKYEIVSSCRGSDLEFKEYEPLFDFVHPDKKAFYITCGDFVTLTDGTGVVHMAPAFGDDDASIGRKYDLPFVQLVDQKGEMKSETPWAGMFVKDADKEILSMLRENGSLFAAPVFEHSYPHCWRCGTPLIYYARDSWFIEMTKIKDNLIANNNTVHWVPESIGKGRFGDWLENIQDWGISRNRYWGTPLNIWECECGHQHSIGGIEELKSMSDNCPDDIELHRPYIDAVTIKCEKCGGEMKRVPEVIDCWFDSGAMSFAQHHYPFENKDLFEQQFPADFISEAVDQTRGWFYSLLAISTLLFDVAPFKNVVVLGLVQDENGQKMSKSKGNAIDPFKALEEYGADAIRWYFYTNSAPWLPSKFSGKAVLEGQRKFMSTLWNTYAFYILYANIDKFNPYEHKLDYDNLATMDKWLLSRLNTMIKEVTGCLEDYKIPEAAKALQDFTDEMSNWYVRRSRQRFWVKGEADDKTNAYMTLFTALHDVVRAAAPMIPFMAEDIYQNLVRSVNPSAPESVHLCSFPESDEALIDTELEKQMQRVLDIVTLGRAARNEAVIKNRQPIGKMFIVADGSSQGEFKEIIEEELNVKDAEFITDASDYAGYIFKPQLRILGKKLGARLGEVSEALKNLDGNAAKKELDSTGSITLHLKDGDLALSEEELIIETTKAEGFASVSEKGITVVLDTTLTDELIEEGFVREIISKLQAMRREADFDVLDHIIVTASGSTKIIDIIKNNKDKIMHDVLADDIIITDTFDSGALKDVNGEDTFLEVKKV